MYKYVIFDLDGTLTDSSEGITKSAAHALKHFGITKYSLDDLKVFIGPPLQDSFPQFGVPVNKTEEAIKVFRERYLTLGKFENKPYPGIIDALKNLKSKGVCLMVATSKPEETAVEILKHFDMYSLFDEVCGASFDHSRESKEAVIGYLLDKADVDRSSALMVGDTVYDVIGARVFNIPTLGVDWGFGSDEDMLKEGAIGIAYTMVHLMEFVTK